jgi:RTX calcium-binding nonapeptide repeat (4 copies)
LRKPAAAAALAALVLAAWAPQAFAATAAVESAGLRPGVAPSAGLVYRAAPGELNRLVATTRPGEPGAVELRDSGAAIAPGAGCERIDDHAVACSPGRLTGLQAAAPAEFARVTAQLRDGADEASMGAGPRVDLSGGPGDDELRGGASGDRLDGGAGRDDVGGGRGDDVLAEVDVPGRDVLDGGPGRDRLDYGGRRLPVSVSLSRGRSGDGDVLRRLEDVRGGRGGDLLTGDRRANELRGGGGADRLRCGGGADLVRGPAAADRLAGDCERVLVEGRRPASFGVLVSQPLRAGRSGQVDVRLRDPGTGGDEAFRGRVLLRFKGLLLGRPSRMISLGRGGRAVARIGIVDAALSRLTASRRLTVQVVLNDAAFTTILRAPVRPRETGGGTPA